MSEEADAKFNFKPEQVAAFEPVMKAFNICSFKWDVRVRRFVVTLGEEGQKRFIGRGATLCDALKFAMKSLLRAAGEDD